MSKCLISVDAISRRRRGWVTRMIVFRTDDIGLSVGSTNTFSADIRGRQGEVTMSEDRTYVCVV